MEQRRVTVQLDSFYDFTHKANLDPRLLFIIGTVASTRISGINEQRISDINEHLRTIHHFDRKNLTFIWPDQ